MEEVPVKRGGNHRIFAVVLIVLGLLAILLPFIVGVAITAILGWVLLLAALAHFAFGWSARHTGAAIWQAVIGLVYVIVALYLILHPARGLVTLTLLLAIYFIVEGIFEVVLFFRLRGSHRADPYLWDGLITLLLGILIWSHWPFSSAWALGTLVGVSLLISGITRLIFRTSVSPLGGVLPV